VGLSSTIRIVWRVGSRAERRGVLMGNQPYR
jgi:hypothetical protein